MTRAGIAQRLRQAVEKAAKSDPSLLNRRISPHTIRHTAAQMPFAGLFDEDFGNDGFKDSDDNDDVEDDDAVSYALSVTGGPDAATNLTDMLSNKSVVLNLVGSEVVGTISVGGLEVFSLSVDANSGVVTLREKKGKSPIN